MAPTVDELIHPTGCEFTLERLWFFRFFVGILICVNNGACFVFAIFSPYMKRGGFSYTQTQVNIVSTVGVLLSYFSLPTGFLYDAKGPSVTLLTGTIMNVFGWIGLYFIFSDVDNPPWGTSVLLMCFFYGFSQLSASFFEQGSVLTNLKAFSCYQGRVVLIQKTFMGLGSALVAQIYVAFFEKQFASIGPFFVFLFVFSAIAGGLSVRYLRLPTPETRCLGLNVMDPDTQRRGGGEPTLFEKPFNVGTAILCAAVLFILVTSLVENFFVVSTVVRYLVGFTTIALCLSFIAMMLTTPSYRVNVGGYDVSAQLADGGTMSAIASPTKPIAVPVSGASNGCVEGDKPTGSASLTTETARERTERPHYGSDSVAHADSADGPRGLMAVTSGTHRKADTVPDVAGGDGLQTTYILNDRSLFDNLRHREIWLMWFVCLGAWGSMTVVSSNSSQIYQALAGDAFSLTVNTVFVSIYGVASAFGRIFVGYCHPIFEQRKKPMALLLILAPALNVVGLPLFCLFPVSLLFVPFFVVGLATGVSWGSTVLIITSLFTATNCGKHYSWLYTAGMLSPLLFNMALFGPVYDHYSAQQGQSDQHLCNGVVCIAAPLLVCTAVNAVAVPVAVHFNRRIAERRGIVIDSSVEAF